MKKIILLILFTIPLSSLAQDSNLGNWLIYFGNKKIDSDFNLHHEVQYRNYNGIGDLEQLLLRTGVGYNLTENNANLLLGYGFINSQNYIDEDEKIGINEHRIYQQFISRHSLGIVNLQHRYRFEQRWVDDTDMRLRFRYFLSIKVPFSTEGVTEDSWYLSAYNEIFINSESEVFDRNRTYLGIGYKLNDFAKFELGYMNQFLNGGSRDQLNIITFLNF